MNIFTKAVSPPTAVIQVAANDYQRRPILSRENGILLYGPPQTGFSLGNLHPYDIILPLPVSRSTHGAFSLYRCQDPNEARTIFSAYKNVIPYFEKLSNKIGPSELQPICDMMRENPKFSLAHIAVKSNKLYLFKDPAVARMVDDEYCGMTPVMLAITMNDVKSVEALLALKCSLNILDPKGQSVIHYAAKSNKEILELLIQSLDSLDLLNQPDMSGRPPLYYSISMDKTDVTEILFDVGASFNFFSHDALNEILHLCKSGNMIKLVLNMGANIDAKNSLGLTPLHVFINRGEFNIVIQLLLHNANIHAPNNDGDTPLHLAVAVSDMDIVKALLVFGANVNAANNKNFTPRHLVDLNKQDGSKILSLLHMSDAKRCPKNFMNCENSCKHDGDYDGPLISVSLEVPVTRLQELLNVATMERAAEFNRSIKGGRLLCLDGGGIRGLIMIQILMALQEESPKPIIECFDWIAGTSTGGILALALVTGKTLNECRNLYFSLKDDVFKGKKPYLSENYEKLLKKYFGSDTCISTIRKPKLMITAVEFAKSPFTLHLFRNYPSPDELLRNNGETSANINSVSIWEVLRATSAAPGYFYPSSTYIDGGILANNPTLDALTEILEYGLAQRATNSQNYVSFATVVVSCGTGVIPTTSVIGSISSYTSQLPNEKESTVSKIAALAKFVYKSASKLLNVVVDVITGSDGRFIDRARAWCCSAGVPYYRFSPPMSIDLPLDETSNEMLIHMLWETMIYMRKNKALVKDAIACLNRD